MNVSNNFQINKLIGGFKKINFSIFLNFFGNVSSSYSVCSLTSTPSSAISISNSSSDTYDALCQHCQGQCHCRQQQLWTTSKWRPVNWPQWPLIKKVLIGAAIFALLTWLLVYLILHFYLEAKDSNDPE